MTNTIDDRSEQVKFTLKVKGACEGDSLSYEKLRQTNYSTFRKGVMQWDYGFALINPSCDIRYADKIVVG